MRTLVKHGLFVVFTAAFALACGSGPQPARDPIANNYPKRQEPVTDPQPQTPRDPIANNDPKPQTSLLGDPKPQASTFGDPEPQKPFYGPGTTNPNEGAHAKQAKTLTDADIVAVASAANEGEVAMAELAKRSATSPDVKNFAAMMITHHNGAQAKAKTLMKKASLSPSDNEFSNQLKSDTTSTLATLRGLKGKEFDRAYVDAQVKAHREVLTLVDDRMMPNVQNGDLKTHLYEMRKTVSEHLDRATDLQQKLGQPVGRSDANTSDTKAKATKTGVSTDVK